MHEKLKVITGKDGFKFINIDMKDKLKNKINSLKIFIHKKIYNKIKIIDGEEYLEFPLLNAKIEKTEKHNYVIRENTYFNIYRLNTNILIDKSSCYIKNIYNLNYTRIILNYIINDENIMFINSSLPYVIYEVLLKMKLNDKFLYKYIIYKKDINNNLFEINKVDEV